MLRLGIREKKTIDSTRKDDDVTTRLWKEGALEVLKRRVIKQNQSKISNSKIFK